MQQERNKTLCVYISIIISSFFFEKNKQLTLRGVQVVVSREEGREEERITSFTFKWRGIMWCHHHHHLLYSFSPPSFTPIEDDDDDDRQAQYLH